MSNALTCSVSLAAASTAKASQKTASQRYLGSKGSPLSSLQRLPNLSSALPATSGPSTTGAWKGSPNASTAAARSSVSSSTVKTTSKTTKEKTYVFLFVLCSVFFTRNLFHYFSDFHSPLCILRSPLSAL